MPYTTSLAPPYATITIRTTTKPIDLSNTYYHPNKETLTASTITNLATESVTTLSPTPDPRVSNAMIVKLEGTE